MIPRLPPVLLALIGGASVYGIKYALDRFEPKAIGPPGSSEHYERVLKYRRNVKNAGVAAAASGLIYAGYWIYESRQHRQSPAVVSHKDYEHSRAFYEDQYKEREKKFAEEREALLQSEREKEKLARQQLEHEVAAMKKAIDKNK
ncbi:uncharacterized protein B0P05DRAFT_563299 [Gilbertella persicaria]|uniref:uncharacterized protein n=1 Tax=Gilbertella persicaria TaxID=101096 RepID=UPI002221159E|nr:uncharacterized protein B0P05DRAFT_563299 [Gilbertella persicaria]KAI8050157.1 hypothetical protein B0P05DRAFT_563299 [Gilbertella persicaria]